MIDDKTHHFEQMGLTSQHVQAAKRIYYQAFANSKPIPFWCLQINALRPNVQFWALVSDNELCGWIYLLVGKGIVFIYYCAVEQQYRSHGYGSLMMNWLKQRFPKHRLALNLPLPDGYETQRKRFYLRHGFHHTDFVYTERGLLSDVLVCQGDLTAAEYVALLRPFAFYCYPIRTIPRT